jgi:hypothetical protein
MHRRNFEASVLTHSQYEVPFKGGASQKSSTSNPLPDDFPKFQEDIEPQREIDSIPVFWFMISACGLSGISGHLAMRDVSMIALRPHAATTEAIAHLPIFAFEPRERRVQ